MESKQTEFGVIVWWFCPQLQKAVASSAWCPVSWFKQSPIHKVVEGGRIHLHILLAV